MFFKSFAHFAFLAPFLYHTVAAQTACNNSPSLCERTYGNITHLGAHDSAFVRNATNNFDVAGNQFFDSVTQLDAGVRLLTTQVHSQSGEWHLCHTTCDLLDVGTLSSWLSSIKSWLDSNPNEVVTILLVNSDNADASALNSEFEAANIISYGYVPPSNTISTTWPTLSSMIANNKRLVTFVASLSDNTGAPYLLNEFSYVFENQFDNTNATAFSCEPNRPTTLSSTTAAASSGLLFLMNHFLDEQQAFSVEIPDVNAVNVTNAAEGTGSLGESASECSVVYGHAPWGILVDFFNVASAIDQVDVMNGINDAMGRKTVTDQVVTRDSDTSGSRQGASLSALVVPVALAVMWFGGF